LIGFYINTNPGMKGINEFETNTFQIQTWLYSPTLPIETKIAQIQSIVEPTTSTLPMQSSIVPILPIQSPIRLTPPMQTLIAPTPSVGA